jgi:hypothetical protein
MSAAPPGAEPIERHQDSSPKISREYLAVGGLFVIVLAIVLGSYAFRRRSEDQSDSADH